MSTRAYRIITIKLEDTPSINLSRQEELANFLGMYNDSGEFEIERAMIKELLDSQELIKKYDVDDLQLEQLKKDYDSTDDDYIYYQAY